jgi:hypothetical protein
MCLLRFENNLLAIEDVRFDIEENTIIEAFISLALPLLDVTYVTATSFT